MKLFSVFKCECVGVWVISGNYLVRLWPLTPPPPLTSHILFNWREDGHAFIHMHTHTPAHTLGYKGFVFVSAGSKFWDLMIPLVRVVQGGKTWLDYQGMSRNLIKHISESVLTHSHRPESALFISRYVKSFQIKSLHIISPPRWVRHR